MKSWNVFLSISIIVGCLVRSAGLANADMSSDVDELIAEQIASKQISGAVTMVIHRGEIIHFSPAGFANLEEARSMTKDTIFRIASLTKNYSAVLIKILEEEGKLKVTDKVEKFLPEFKDMVLQTDDEEGDVDLRIWHLMSHTSGVNIPDGYSETNDLKTAAHLIANQSLQFRPGDQWKYSKGMDVCGRIVEVVSGQSFDAFLKEKITGPLQFNDTAYFVAPEKSDRLAVVYFPDPKNRGLKRGDHPFYSTAPTRCLKPNPSSGLYASTAEVGEYYTMLLNGGEINGTRILSAKSVQELTRGWTKSLPTNPIEGFQWGLGFGVVGEATDGEHSAVTAMLSQGTFGHGGAYGTQAWADPTTQTVYLLMIQRKGFGNGDLCDLRRKFQKIVAAGLPDPVE